jgi:hypothetical protein
VPWSRRNSKSPQRDASNPNPEGLLVPQPTSASSESEESRSTKSTSSRGRNLVRKISNRLRSSSSVSLEPGLLTKKDLEQIEGWTRGFDKYNQLVTNQVSRNQSTSGEEFARLCKTLTKQCGGHFVDGLPESVLDLALLWCPGERIHRKSLEATDPSWSWTGWEGAVNFPFDPTNCPDIPNAKEAPIYFKSEIGNFEIGPESAPYTIRRATKEKLRIGYHSQFKPLLGNLDQLSSSESHTLRFSALTIPVENFDVRQLCMDDGTEIPCSELLNEQKQRCGVIMDYENLLTAHVAKESTFEFVLLSRNLRCKPVPTKQSATVTTHPPGTPIWNGKRFVWSEEVDDFDESVFADGEWRMLNVMMIQHMDEGYAERVAVGRIHEDAWKARNPVQKKIVLK